MYILAAPLYGTCCSSMPAMWFSISPATWAEVPMPFDPNENCRARLAAASAISPLMSLAGKFAASDQCHGVVTNARERLQVLDLVGKVLALHCVDAQ